MANLYGRVLAKAKAGRANEDAAFMGDANSYRQALLQGAGEGVSAGVGSINNYLAGAGPLADSGARAALSARLASGLYSGVQTNYANYLAQAMRARQQYRYQAALQKAALKAQQTGLGGVVGGIAGSVLGGPIGGAIGAKLGGGLTHGGPIGGGAGDLATPYLPEYQDFLNQNYYDPYKAPKINPYPTLMRRGIR
jgi:hypothetical protein